MSTLLQQMQAAANEAAESAVDMNVATKGGGGILYPEGYCFARLVEVIELGSHRQEFNGQLKDAAPQFRLGFAIWGEGYQQEDGQPGFIRTYELSLSTNEKAKAFKLFKKLNYKGLAKTYAQLLGQPFLLKVAHYTAKTAGSKPRSIIDLEGFLPPLDPVTKNPYPIPDAPEDAYKLFLWDKPTKAMWDSLFIEGKFDDGNSKNFVQETIQKATDYPGSAIEILLSGGIGAIPSLAVPSVPSTPNAVVPDAPANPVSPVPAGSPVPVPAETSAPVLQIPAAVVVDVPWNDPAKAAPAAPAVPAVPAMPVMPALPTAPAA